MGRSPLPIYGLLFLDSWPIQRCYIRLTLMLLAFLSAYYAEGADITCILEAYCNSKGTDNHYYIVVV